MIRLEPAGAEALLLVLAEAPDADLPLRIAALAERIRLQLGELLTDLVPGWTTLLLHYDLLRTDHLQLAERLAPLLEAWLRDCAPAVAGRLHEIPVWYAGADLASVAQACGLSVAEVIELHSAGEYRVGAIGFAPGFAYLGELQGLAAELGLGADITFLGHRGDLREIMAVSDLVCALSQQPESFGRTVLEALAIGKPVAGYACGGVGELLDDWFQPGKVPPGDATRLLEATRSILHAQQEPAAVGEPYTLASMCRGTLAVYDELLASPH